jgi:putative hydrolase of the HAD superfamily
VTGVSSIFWDMGGVFLTNGWDTHARALAVQQFGLDADEFAERHHQALEPFETGEITLDEYLDRTVFCRPRRFTREAFRDFMFAQSKVLPECRDLVDRLAQSGRWEMIALNNESREINTYRIETFHLRQDFDLFLSSCYVRMRKPDIGIYRLALDVTQRAPTECVFIDDRPINLEPAAALEMHTIHYQSATQLSADLRELGVAL